MKYLIMLVVLTFFTSVVSADTKSELNGGWLCPIKSEEEGIIFKIALYNQYDVKNMRYNSKGINSMYLDSPEPLAQYSSTESGTFEIENDLLTFKFESVDFKVLNDPAKILSPELFNELKESYAANSDPVKILSISAGVRISIDPVTGKSSECYKI